MIYIFWTAATEEEATKIIHSLLDKKLIACASVLPKVKSIYRWKGKIEESVEAKVILKTQAHHFDSVQKQIKAQASYEIPEILQISIPKGNPDYITWVTEETS